MVQLATVKLKRCKDRWWEFQSLCDSLIRFDRDGLGMAGILRTQSKADFEKCSFFKGKLLLVEVPIIGWQMRAVAVLSLLNYLKRRLEIDFEFSKKIHFMLTQIYEPIGRRFSERRLYISAKIPERGKQVQES